MERTLDLTSRDDIRRILVIKWSALGDIIISSTVFEDIYRAFPDREIHLNTLPAFRHLFEQDPRFKKIISPDIRSGGIHGILHWLREIRGNRYDLIIDLQCNDRSRMLQSLLLLSGYRAPYRVGNRKHFPHNIYPDVPLREIQAIEIQRATIKAAGIPARTPRPVLHISESTHQRARELTRKHDLKAHTYAVFMPGSQAGGHLKRWGASRYAELASQLHESGIGRIVLIGGPDETEECERIEQACGDWLVNLCNQTRIQDIIPLCQSACFIVSNDTGTAHVASATDRPILVICGPTDPRRVKPCGDNVKTLQADLPCINCYQKECSHHSCMKAITPEQVISCIGFDQISACKSD